MATERIIALDRARTFITLLVVLHHSVVNYTYFGNGDRMRWLGFDLVVLFNDSFFMACMFFISGLFVHHSLTRRGPGNFLGRPRLAIGRAFYDLDLGGDADRLLSELSALSSAGNDRFQFLPFLVAHVDDRSLAVGVGMVLVGVAGARWARRAAMGGGTPGNRRAWATRLCLARPADDRVRRVPDVLDHGLSADAPDLWRFILAGTGPLSVSDSDQPYPALCRILLASVWVRSA